MRYLISSAMVTACCHMLLTSHASAMSSQELCATVLEQYGIRTEGCDLEDDQPTTSKQASNSAPNPGEVTPEMRENHVFFRGGGAELDDAARAQLAVLIDVLKAPLMKDACLRLIGHSDTSGPESRNMQISIERANAVAFHLQNGLNDGTRVRQVNAEGERQPLAGFDGNSPYNRRVAILAKTCD